MLLTFTKLLHTCKEEFIYENKFLRRGNRDDCYKIWIEFMTKVYFKSKLNFIVVAVFFFDESQCKCVYSFTDENFQN